MSVFYVLLFTLLKANAEFTDPFTSDILCEGETLTIPWDFQGDREHLLSIEWYFENTRMMSVVLSRNGSALSAVPTDPYIDRVSRTSTPYDATNTDVTMGTAVGIRLANVKTLDEGKYSVLAKILKADGSGYYEVKSEDIDIKVIPDVTLKIQKENDLLICYVGGDTKDNALTFYKDGFEIRTGIDRTDRSVKLHISDHGDGEYYCSYHNPDGNKTCSQSDVYTLSHVHSTEDNTAADIDSTIPVNYIGGEMADENSSGTGTAIGIVVGVMIFTIIIVVVVFIYRRKLFTKSISGTITKGTKARQEDFGPTENTSGEAEPLNISKEQHEHCTGTSDKTSDEHKVTIEDNVILPDSNMNNTTPHSIESYENMSNRVDNNNLEQRGPLSEIVQVGDDETDKKAGDQTMLSSDTIAQSLSTNDTYQNTHNRSVQSTVSAKSVNDKTVKTDGNKPPNDSTPHGTEQCSNGSDEKTNEYKEPTSDKRDLNERCEISTDTKQGPTDTHRDNTNDNTNHFATHPGSGQVRDTGMEENAGDKGPFSSDNIEKSVGISDANQNTHDPFVQSKNITDSKSYHAETPSAQDFTSYPTESPDDSIKVNKNTRETNLMPDTNSNPSIPNDDSCSNPLNETISREKVAEMRNEIKLEKRQEKTNKTSKHLKEKKREALALPQKTP